MLIERRERNPFDMVKASDFTDAQIQAHWVDLSPDHALEHLLKPDLVMPMILLGGKGSGETHLLRYFSAPVQAARRGGDLLEAMREDHYVGIYIRAEGLNTTKFAKKGQDDEAWLAIFGMYFEIWLATSLLENIAAAVARVATGRQDADFAAAAAKLFNDDVACQFSSFDGFSKYLQDVRRSVDLIVDNAALSRSVTGINLNFSPGKLIYGLPELIQTIYPELSSVLLVYLIDEVENLTADQQRFLNTLVRYRKGHASIKIGTRLYGIKTLETLNSGEPIRRDSEYEQVELDDFLRGNSKMYEDFCRRLIVHRLEYHHMRGRNLSSDMIADSFAEVENANFSARTALALVKSWDDKERERPYFAKARTLMREGGYKAAFIDELLSELHVPSSPLLEKLALFKLYRDWEPDPAALLDSARAFGAQARALSDGDEAGADDLRSILSYFRTDLMAQLYRDCRKSSPYAGLPTLIGISQGIPRNLLSALKHIYRRSLFAGERPFEEGRISVESQSLGVRDSAAWFWEDAQPDEHSHKVREAVDVLATLFRTLRFSERPPECACATFSVRVDALSEESQRILTIAEKWSYLIRIKSGASDKNDRSLRTKFQLGPMLAPRWGLSLSRRGTEGLTEAFGNAVFDAGRRDGLRGLFEKRVAGLLGKRFVKRGKEEQDSLFA